jgi:hypothetical protein
MWVIRLNWSKKLWLGALMRRNDVGTAAKIRSKYIYMQEKVLNDYKLPRSCVHKRYLVPKKDLTVLIVAMTSVEQTAVPLPNVLLFGDLCPSHLLGRSRLPDCVSAVLNMNAMEKVQNIP